MLALCRSTRQLILYFSRSARDSGVVLGCSKARKRSAEDLADSGPSAIVSRGQEATLKGLNERGDVKKVPLLSHMPITSPLRRCTRAEDHKLANLLSEHLKGEKRERKPSSSLFMYCLVVRSSQPVNRTHQSSTSMPTLAPRASNESTLLLASSSNSVRFALPAATTREEQSDSSSSNNTGGLYTSIIAFFDERRTLGPRLAPFTLDHSDDFCVSGVFLVVALSFFLLFGWGSLQPPPAGDSDPEIFWPGALAVWVSAWVNAFWAFGRMIHYGVEATVVVARWIELCMPSPASSPSALSSPPS